MTTRYYVAIAALALIVSGCTATAADPGPPQACLDALDAADESHQLAAEGFGAAAAGFAAASELDVDGILDANERMGAVEPELGAAMQRYRAAAELCRGGAQA